MKKKVAIIGSGFSGLATAAYSAKAGFEVHVYEKHSQPGGRARQFRTPEGYVFDMGPSWYWMPDIIESFFADFGCSTSDYFHLISLNPQFEIIFADEKMAVPEKYDDLKLLFEHFEKGAGKRLDAFMQSAKYKYEVGMQEFVNKPCHHWGEFLSPKIAKSALQLNLLSNFRNYVNRYFKHPKLRILMEFPVIFLGASPQKIPALYSLMNYGGYALGTHYPMGGFHQLVSAMHQITKAQGVCFHFNQEVEQLKVVDNQLSGLIINGTHHPFDAVIASSDYHHSESLLPKPYRNYTEKFWKKKTFAPSCLIYYLGIKTKIPQLKHHTLFFEHDLDTHIDCIYNEKRWPEKPLFYCCNPSKTDPNVAPNNAENIFLLMPLATGIHDEERLREEYLRKMLHRIEKLTGVQNLISKIEYKKSFCVRDFIDEYHAYEGNAYGLANTLFQTAVLKPKIKNKKINNLWYTGQLTVPGPGVPPSIISGKIVAKELQSLLSLQK